MRGSEESQVALLVYKLRIFRGTKIVLRSREEEKSVIGFY